MTIDPRQSHRAGTSLDDLCRACGMDRRHTVIVAAIDGKPSRVICDYCGSQHNYRGGDRVKRPTGARTRHRAAEPFDPVTQRERSGPPMTNPTTDAPGQDLELLLRRIIREEAGLTPVAPADKWRGGELVLRPGREGLQEKSWPIESFFHKVVMIRNRLRVLEQQINGAELPEELKLKLQGYITACYGSLTGLNVLFAEDEDRFRGSGSRG
jgi:hypothetical protein